MKNYDVTITQTLEKIVTVEAENAEQAREIVEQQWYSIDQVLDPDDYVGVTFAVSKD